MQKLMLGLVHSLVCLMLIMSCGFQIPQSITIKAEPGLRVPLGSPFKSLGEGERLEDLISRDNILRMMGEAADGYSAVAKIEVYDYQMGLLSDGTLEADFLGIDPDSQVYAVRYPIAEMQLDLNKYVQGVIDDMYPGSWGYEVPPAIFDNPLTSYPIYLTDDGPKFDATDITPLFSIPLPEMYRLVSEVTGNKFGLRISRVAGKEDNVEVSIPALGINDYIKGVSFDDPDGQWLEFVVNDNPTTFRPQDALAPAGELQIFIRLTDSYPGTNTLEMVFEWEEATLDTSGIKGTRLEGSYPIDNNLGAFLGSGVEFKIIDGYIYTSGGNDAFTATMSLTFNGENLIGSDPSLTLVPSPQFEGTIVGSLPESSLANVINLAPYISADYSASPNPPNLDYEINIIDWLLRKEELGTDDEKITIDLVILLPLEFKVSGGDPNSDYATLDLKGVFPEITEDLLLRSGAGDDNDNLFKMLTDVSIHIGSIKNTIMEHQKFAIGVSGISDGIPYNKSLNLGDTNPIITIYNNEIAYPFTPQFEFLVEKDEGEDFATLRILRTDNPEFDFFITITANVFIDETINL